MTTVWIRIPSMVPNYKDVQSGLLIMIDWTKAPNNVSNDLSPITGKSYAAIKCESVTAFTSQTLEEQRRFLKMNLALNMRMIWRLI